MLGNTSGLHLNELTFLMGIYTYTLLAESMIPPWRDFFICYVSQLSLMW